MNSPPTRSADALPTLVIRGIVRALLIISATALGATVLPSALGFELLAVQGGSMGEAMPNGSLAVVSSKTAERIEHGDIIVVQGSPGTRSIVHRVVKIDGKPGERLATTRGDANSTDDPAAYPLQGDVRVSAHVVPYLGFVLIFVTTPLGWLLGIALPSCVVSFLVIRAIWREEDSADQAAVVLGHWTTRYGLSATQIST